VRRFGDSAMTPRKELRKLRWNFVPVRGLPRAPEDRDTSGVAHSPDQKWCSSRIRPSLSLRKRRTDRRDNPSRRLFFHRERACGARSRSAHGWAAPPPQLVKNELERPERRRSGEAPEDWTLPRQGMHRGYLRLCTVQLIAHKSRPLLGPAGHLVELSQIPLAHPSST
jgi:hypothetical protein